MESIYKVSIYMIQIVNLIFCCQRQGVLWEVEVMSLDKALVAIYTTLKRKNKSARNNNIGGVEVRSLAWSAQAFDINLQRNNLFEVCTGGYAHIK